ncbi:hypothetical protein GCM10009636_24270 [Arthrobacter koreensis]
MPARPGKPATEQDGAGRARPGFPPAVKPAPSWDHTRLTSNEGWERLHGPAADGPFCPVRPRTRVDSERRCLPGRSTHGRGSAEIPTRRETCLLLRSHLPRQ